MEVFVVANPAAGQESFDVKTLNARFAERGVDWEVRFTKNVGDGGALARQAIALGADIVVAYGGDGTVTEVAGGLVGSSVPLAILPGGTANVMSVELGIPAGFNEALALVLNEELTTRPLDVGQVGDRHFLLRLSMGLEAQMVAGADRGLKDRLGTLAYALSALKALVGPPKILYRFEVDGRPLEEEGVACIVANSGNLGAPGLKLAPDVSVSDGLLDLFVINDVTLPALLGMAAHVLGQDHPSPDTVHHLQGESITVTAAPESEVQCDGELIGGTPISVRVLPGAIRVIAPPTEGAGG